MWFHYRQYNSGGFFIFDEEKGITGHVLIEAENADVANARALSIGLYWDGVDEDLDCPCCGDRWCPTFDGTKEPLVYGKPARNYNGYVWMEDGREIVLHHSDGRIEWICVVANK